MNTETTPASGSTARPRPLFKPTPLYELKEGDTFCLSGYGMKDRIMYTKEYTFKRKNGDANIDVCSCSYLAQNGSRSEKNFDADKVVLLMQRKKQESSIGNS